MRRKIIDFLQEHQVPCFFKELTSYECPGCGITRALILLLEGDVKESFLMYPALIPLILFFVLLLVWIFMKKKFLERIIKINFILVLALIMFNYIANLIQ